MDNFEEVITLKARAEGIKAKSERGILLLALDDPAVTGYHEYTYARKKYIEETYNDTNKGIINKAFTDYGVKKMLVTCYDSTNSETLSDALALIDGKKFNYGAAPYITDDADKKVFGDFVKDQRKASNILTHCVLNDYVGDHEGIINFITEEITYTDKTTVTGNQFCVDFACVCCTTAIDKSVSSYRFGNVAKVKEILDRNTATNEGKVYLYWDEDIKNFISSRAVNSLTTLGDNKKESLKSIRICEILDMIQDDLKIDWKLNYRDKLENTYNNRQNLMNKFTIYLKALIKKGYLNDSADCKSFAELSIDKTRSYLEDNGVDTSEMTDLQILSADLDTHVFADVHTYPVNVTEDLNLDVYY